MSKEYLIHTPSGKRVEVLTRRYDEILVKFPKGLELWISLDKLKAEAKPE